MPAIIVAKLGNNETEGEPPGWAFLLQHHGIKTNFALTDLDLYLHHGISLEFINEYGEVIFTFVIIILMSCPNI